MVQEKLGAERHFMLSRSSPHSASAIVSTVSQGTQESVRMTVTFFPTANSTSDHVIVASHAFGRAHFLRLHSVVRDLRIKRGETRRYAERRTIIAVEYELSEVIPVF
jgi:hypothetical protein